MQWNCPHCGTGLAVANDALKTGWSFSRCYKCGGFALVRKTEINIIKVDKAPPGERIILPEASADPTAGLMSSQATARYTKHKLGKNTPPPPPLSHVHGTQTIELSKPFPDPLPEIAPQKNKALPFGIAFAALMAVGSGSYLYFQGQALWEKTHSAPMTEARHITTSQAAPQASQEIVAAPKIVDLAPKEVQLAQEVKPVPVITDQVQRSAMAPIKLQDEPLWVTVSISPRANVHSGPGMNFPVVATADINSKYLVTETKSRWFKIASGWIRNDLVQLSSTKP